MKCTEVAEDDVRQAAQLINLLRSAEVTLGGAKDICAAADAVRWLQRTAVAIGEGFQTPASPPAPAEPAPAAEGLKIKQYNPGKVGKGK